MKNTLFILLSSTLFVGCYQRNPDGSLELDRDYHHNFASRPHIEVIDSCEYIMWESRLAHKGNCKFCENRRDIVPGPPVEED